MINSGAVIRSTVASLAVAVTISACASPAPSLNAPVAGSSGPASKVEITTNLPSPKFGQTTNSGVYLIGPLDTLQISVFQAESLSGTFQVDNSGSITMPLIGRVQAAGRSSLQVQDDIANRLAASYMQSPQVTVQVSGFNSQKITVDGAIQKPGSYPVTSGSTTLLEYISIAGGMPRTADESSVAVYRNVGGKQYVARYDVGAIRSGKAQNPPVYGGDTIVVAQSATRSAWNDVLSASPILGLAARLAY